MAQTAVLTKLDLVAATSRTLFVTWTCNNSNIKEYEVVWYYSWGANVAPKEVITTTEKYCMYTPPEYATHVTVAVKPISTTYKEGGVEKHYWEVGYSTKMTYWYSENPPSAPPSPEVEIKDYTLTATVRNIDDLNATSIEFQVVKDDSTIFATGTSNIVTGVASYSCSINPGSNYKVRCRAVKDGQYSEWSDYSGNSGTKPGSSISLTTCKANSKTSVYLEWTVVSSATSYDIEYTTKLSYFDGSDQTSTVSGIESTHYEKTGLEPGEEYFFRVRAVNSQGYSSWSSPKQVVLGSEPSSPTTWSSTTTVIVGEPLTLYWVHNSEDNSTQKKAEIELTINGVTTTHTVDTTGEEDDEKTMHYSVDTSGYSEGATILWRVRTAGVTGVFGEWSIQRRVDLYAPPTLALNLLDISGEVMSTLTSFPFFVKGEAGPSTQTPLGYHITVASRNHYITLDEIGNQKVVNQGEIVYSKYFDISTDLSVELSAGDIDLENNVTYDLTCTVSMNSGLTAEATSSFIVAWTEETYTPNASIGIDRESVSASIGPYCKDAVGDLISGVLLSVYRRELDGTFTEIAKGLDNTKSIFVTDPHPALDFARYRIVAISEATGAVSYYDLPAYPVKEIAVVIQWDEAWRDYESSEHSLAEPLWSGSLLKLPYNIDISDDYSMDVSLIKYIGRDHPVAYYGTQRGESSSWKVDIPKYDKETLFAIRRLAIWPGNVYVREPSGTGYWANITVSFSQKYLETVIPIQFNVTRVAGGM